MTARQASVKSSAARTAEVEARRSPLPALPARSESTRTRTLRFAEAACAAATCDILRSSVVLAARWMDMRSSFCSSSSFAMLPVCSCQASANPAMPDTIAETKAMIKVMFIAATPCKPHASAAAASIRPSSVCCLVSNSRSQLQTDSAGTPRTNLDNPPHWPWQRYWICTAH